MARCEQLPRITKVPAERTVVCAKFSEGRIELTALPHVDVPQFLFLLDKQWYRAVIQERVSDTLAYVLYIDFGNHEDVKVEDLRDITDEWMQVPRMLIPVALEGTFNNWKIA